MKKINVVNLDKLLDNFSEIEKVSERSLKIELKLLSIDIFLYRGKLFKWRFLLNIVS